MMIVWCVLIVLCVSILFVVFSGWCGDIVNIYFIVLSLNYLKFGIVGGLLVVLMIRFVWLLCNVF